MKLHNSLTKKKTLFKPIKSHLVGIYSCGPTVYDHVHIGNLRSFITADLLVRVLREVEGYKIKWVMNTTDIDDKIIARLQAEKHYRDPEKARLQLTRQYENLFLADIAAVGMDVRAMTLVRATEHIKKMQDLICRLVSEGIAYVVDGSIYFSILKYQTSGKIYGQLTNAHFEGQPRITDDQDQKEGLADFALWKKAKPNEPAWDFEINGQNLRGRPGWHIECSAMSTQYLGDIFDIHTGGVDLRFPHHENEIAQAGGRLANYFIHNEMLTVKEEKMSKSLANFYKLAEIKDGMAFRYLVLGAHYRNKMDFSFEALHSARARLNHIYEFVSKLINNRLVSKKGQSLAEKVEKQFNQALLDDLDTPKALAAVAKLTRAVELDSKSMLEVIRHVDTVLDLGIDQKALKISDKKSMELLRQRAKARKQKDYELADKIRGQLKSSHVGVEDTPSGQVAWRLQIGR